MAVWTKASSRRHLSAPVWVFRMRDWNASLPISTKTVMVRSTTTNGEVRGIDSSHDRTPKKLTQKSQISFSSSQPRRPASKRSFPTISPPHR